MKTTKLLFLLAFIQFGFGFNQVRACSPWSALQLTNYEIIGDFLYLDITSHTGWQCCYTAQVELACASGSFTGAWNHVTSQICKGSGSGSFSSWSTPEPFPTLAIDISMYCPGTALMFRMRENGPDGFGPISATFNVVVPGSSGTFTSSVSADPEVLCLGECSDLTGTSDNNCGTVSYLWSTGETTPSINVCPAETTTYTFTATDSGDACGQVVLTEEVTIVVDNTLVAGQVSVDPIEICEGDDVTLTIQGQIGQVQWQSSASPGGPWTDIVGATSSEYTHGPVTENTYFQATVSNCVGEEVTNNVLVTVYDYPDVDFSFSGVCLGAETDFTDLSTVTNGSIDTWEWDFGGGNTSTDQNPSFSFTNSGDNSVSLTVWNNGVCASTVELDVAVFPIPEALFNYTTVCATEPTLFLDSSIAAAPSNIVGWEWDILDDGTVNYTTQNPTHTFATGGTYSVTLTVYTDAGCQGFITNQVVVNPVPDASFTASPISGQIPLNVDFTNNSTGGTGHTWDFGNGNGAFSQNADDQSDVYTEPGEYVVTLIVDNGFCTDQATLVINALNLPISYNLPNIFTPNGDGENDILHFNLENANSAYVEIRNRWGNLVGIIDSVDDQLGWNGRDYKSGKPVSDGVYFYTYEFENLDGELFTGHGFVHVKQQL